jgi:hypothetical protein
MMFADDPPPVIVTVPAAKPAEAVVLSRDTRSDILASRDTPLPLIKGRKTEDALLRQTIFLTSVLTMVRPAASAGEDVLRWTYAPYLQRQICFTSMTGVFSCAAAELEDLTEKAQGETPVAQTPAPQAPVAQAPGPTAPPPDPVAEAVRVAVSTILRARADALFEDDRRLKLDPMLKAAGVTVRRIQVSAGLVRR